MLGDRKLPFIAGFDCCHAIQCLTCRLAVVLNLMRRKRKYPLLKIGLNNDLQQSLELLQRRSVYSFEEASIYDNWDWCLLASLLVGCRMEMSRSEWCNRYGVLRKMKCLILKQGTMKLPYIDTEINGHQIKMMYDTGNMVGISVTSEVA